MNTPNDLDNLIAHMEQIRAHVIAWPEPLQPRAADLLLGKLEAHQCVLAATEALRATAADKPHQNEPEEATETQETPEEPSDGSLDAYLLDAYARSVLTPKPDTLKTPTERMKGEGGLTIGDTPVIPLTVGETPDPTTWPVPHADDSNWFSRRDLVGRPGMPTDVSLSRPAGRGQMRVEYHIDGLPEETQHSLREDLPSTLEPPRPQREKLSKPETAKERARLPEQRFEDEPF